jgi:hypothetical protein
MERHLTPPVPVTELAAVPRFPRQVASWCGPSWCRRLLEPGSSPGPVFSPCSRSAWLSAEPLSGIVHLALGRALARQGNLPQAQEQLEWALELVASTAWPCSERTRCCSSRASTTLVLTVRPRGPSSNAPTSWSSGWPTRACFPRCSAEQANA